MPGRPVTEPDEFERRFPAPYGIRRLCSLETMASVASCLGPVWQPLLAVAADAGISYPLCCAAIKRLRVQFGIRVESERQIGVRVTDPASRRRLREICERYWREISAESFARIESPETH